MAWIVLLCLAAFAGPGLLSYSHEEKDEEYLVLHGDEADLRDERGDEIRAQLRKDGVPREEFKRRTDAALGPWQYPLPAPPSWRHPLGTDNLARDQLARLLQGARISLLVALAASVLSLCVGALYGGIAGYLGGYAGQVMMRGVDVLYGIPFLLFVVMLILVFEGDLTGAYGSFLGGNSRMIIILVALGFTYWLPMARIVRAQVLTLREREFALAARALGAGHARILLRHLLPNAAGPIIVTLTLSIPEAIFAEAFLAYIGLGIGAPAASWGTLASEGTQYINAAPHLLLWPALAISITMLAFNFLGDGLRDAFDPRQGDAE